MYEHQIYFQKFELNHSAHQSHLRISFPIRHAYDSIQITLSYSPINEVNEEVRSNALMKEGLGLEYLDYSESIQNKITLSLNSPRGFVGANHHNREEQNVIISPTGSTVGFLSTEIYEGTWELIISCHSLFSNQVVGEVQIIGKSENEVEYSKSSPLSNLKLKNQRKIRKAKNPMEINFVRSELHSHTVHSDGSFEILDLIESAKNEGIQWLAITEHNTMSSIMEIKSGRVQYEGIHIISGLEITTFFGHYLIYGLIDNLHIDWTTVCIDNIEEKVLEHKGKGLVTTVAHPLDIGNPYGTRCRWDFTLNDLYAFDSIEIWNEENPHIKKMNILAYEKWCQLLSEGFEVAATCGRDWHGPTREGERIPYTYLLIPINASELDFLEALRLGRSYASLGPSIQKFIINDEFQIGDRISDNVKWSISSWNIKLHMSDLTLGDTVIIYSEKESLLRFTEFELGVLNTEFSIEDKDYKLLRLEVRDQQDALICFTNPIYK